MKRIQKPGWLLFAGNVREQIDNMKPPKSAKREEGRILDAWRTARRTHPYEGSLHDWQYLIRSLGRESNRHK